MISFLTPSRPLDIDPQRWDRCGQEARRQVLANGFNPLSKKLGDAVRKVQLRLWREGTVK